MILDDSKSESLVSPTKTHIPSSRALDYRQAERRLLFKIDLYTVPVVALLYALCTIDRVNIGNARLAGLERTLNLHGNDFNALLSVFYVSYILFSVPATWAVTWVGPGWMLPGATLVFGVLTVSFAFVKVYHPVNEIPEVTISLTVKRQTFAQAAVVRFLLGIFEAGLFGGCGYYMSRWYRRS